MREALELSIDREALNQVAYDGQYTPGCGPISPNSVFFDKTRKCSERDVARAKKLLADAGLARRLQVRDGHRQQPAAAPGRRGHPGHGSRGGLRHHACGRQEFASALKDNDDGKHQAFLIGWSGRVDPDGNIHQGQACGGSLNATLACDEKMDALLNKAREVSDVAQRHGALPRGHRPASARGGTSIYLYHPNYIVAFPKNLKSYKAVPDGLIRIRAPPGIDMGAALAQSALGRRARVSSILRAGVPA